MGYIVTLTDESVHGAPKVEEYAETLQKAGKIAQKYIDCVKKVFPGTEVMGKGLERWLGEHLRDFDACKVTATVTIEDAAAALYREHGVYISLDGCSCYNPDAIMNE